MKNIKVSIIIPVYNVEKYLSKCLNSAINQTLKDIEIIAVNDGSIDNSINILNEYKNKYNNIFVINQKNKGQSEARNTALKIARGEYIYFLDSDDYIREDLCEVCYRESIKNNLDIITFDAKVFYESNDLIKDNKFNYKRNKNIASNIMRGLEFYEISLREKSYKSPVWLFFYRREFLIKNNFNFYPQILHEDELFTSKALLAAENVKYISEEFFFRRIRNNSIMTSKRSMKNALGYYIVAEKLNEYYRGNAYNNKEIEIHINSFYVSALNIAIQYKGAEEGRELIKNIKKKVRFKRIGFKGRINIYLGVIYSLLKNCIKDKI